MKFLLLLLGFVATSAHAASFDCARATTPDERTVCADPRLSELDSVMGRAFNQARKASSGADQQKTLTAVARSFMTSRRACGTDRSCIFVTYLSALVDYQNSGATEAIPVWANALAIAGGKLPPDTAIPARIGQCSTTQVAKVTTRLDLGHPPKDEDFDSGTAVVFRNSGGQVSYGREDALLHSKPGDKVVMCLISIPADCPPGDDRGKVYTVTNTRTGESWTLPDSQHSCGGA